MRPREIRANQTISKEVCKKIVNTQKKLKKIVITYSRISESATMVKPDIKNGSHAKRNPTGSSSCTTSDSKSGKSFRTDALGDFVDDFQVPLSGSAGPNTRIAFPNHGQLYCVTTTILACLFVTYASLFFINDAVMSARHEGWRDYSTKTEAMVNLSREDKVYPLAGSNPVSKLSVEEFNIYVAVFLFITVIESGLGLELLSSGRAFSDMVGLWSLRRYGGSHNLSSRSL